jgi:GNAT superfamily N-acetyltransferase
MSTLSYEPVSGERALGRLDDIARLRIAVFREWPYLYDGDLDYERDYLAAFAAAPQALVVLARAEGRIVGASTAMPLASAEPAIRKPFEESGRDLSKIFYFGESVLERGWRGHGAGRVFFEARESHAKTCGASSAAFCAVVRPEDHPLRDRRYRPLNGFWRGLGYAPVEGLVCRLKWKDLGDAEETAKPLQFWMRTL